MQVRLNAFLNLVLEESGQFGASTAQGPQSVWTLVAHKTRAFAHTKLRSPDRI